MSCFIRIANLPPETTEQQVAEFLEQEPGFKDRTSFKFVKDATSATAVIGVPWERHVADAVARHFSGRDYHGRPLVVRAAAMFTD
ncbi:MAG: hypothetical protein MZW92_51945 [Comamonadaceae bacterium]|jgi:hypothetical protein|nr:hypothetical protein [Comamonadaceae bacterium]